MKTLSNFAYPAASPSLLAADKTRIENEIQLAEKAGARFIHIDIMDGKFVPNVSLSLDFVKKYSKVHNMVNDVHLMIVEPWKHVRNFVQAGADIVTFHYEACPNEEKILETIKNIQEAGGYAGLSIKPDTPISVLKPFLTRVNLILLMSVEPGKGGQAFIMKSLERLDEIHQFFEEIEPSKRPLLEIDGGINENIIGLVHSKGVDLLVAGSYLYGHDDFAARLKLLETR